MRVKISLAVMAVAVTGVVMAEPYHWKGGASSNWGDAANWVEGIVPPSGADVVINSDSVRVGDCDIGTTMTVGNLTVKKADFRWSGATVTISGDLTIESDCRFYGNGTTLAFPEGEHAVTLGVNNTQEALWLNGSASLLNGVGTVVVDGGGNVRLSQSDSNVPFSGKLVIRAGEFLVYNHVFPNIAEIELDGSTAKFRTWLSSGTMEDAINTNVVLKFADGGMLFPNGSRLSQHIRQIWIDGTQRSSGVWGYDGCASAEHFSVANIKTAAVLTVAEGDGLPGGDEDIVYHWKGGTSSNWGDAANWEENVVPPSGADVEIKADSVRVGDRDIGTTMTVGNLTVKRTDFRWSGATVTINGNLTIEEGCRFYSYSTTLVFPAGRHDVNIGENNSGYATIWLNGDGDLLSGSGTVVVNGSGDISLSNNNTPVPFSGKLVLKAGYFQCYQHAFPNILEIEIDGQVALLRGYNANDFINHDAILKLANGGKYDAQTLPRTQYVRQLWVDGTQRRAGSYGCRGGEASAYLNDNLVNNATIVVAEGAFSLPAGDSIVCVYNQSADNFWGNAANWDGNVEAANGDTIVVSNQAAWGTSGAMFVGKTSSISDIKTRYVKNLLLVGAGGTIYNGKIVVDSDIRLEPTAGIETNSYYLGANNGGSGSGIEFLPGRHLLYCGSNLGFAGTAYISGSGTLVKVGPGRFWVAGRSDAYYVHSFTGELDVAEGDWYFNNREQFPGITNLTVGTSNSVASVKFSDTANISDNADWTISRGSTVALPAGAYKAHNIFINGKGLRAGVYGSATSSAPRKKSAFTGLGTVEVTAGIPNEVGMAIIVR